MHILQQLPPRLTRISRVITWAIISLLITIGVFSHAPAWAETTACTPGNLSIPITPVILYLRYGGPPSTYTVELCDNPAPGDEVSFTTAVTPPNRVLVQPSEFMLDSTDPQIVSVSVLGTHPADVPFTALITHTASSNNEGFDGNTEPVTAYYSPPLAVDDDANTLHGQNVTVNVLANDTDRLGQGFSLPAGATYAPTSGTATRISENSIRYTPNVAFTGIATFTYTVVDAIGNSDVAVVSIYVAPEGVENYEIQSIDPTQGGQIVLTTDFGTVEVDIPVMTGVPANSNVQCVVLQDEGDPEGDTTEPPGGIGTYTGLTITVQCYINGVAAPDSVLDDPITVTVSLPVPAPVIFDGARIVIARWNGTAWVTTGITRLPSDDDTIQFTTSQFGEYVFFAVRDLFFPLLGKQDTGG